MKNIASCNSLTLETYCVCFYPIFKHKPIPKPIEIFTCNFTNGHTVSRFRSLQPKLTTGHKSNYG